MNRLFFKYYYDTTRINLLVSILVGLQEFAICFGSAGMIISFGVYRYFQNEQYTFYLNHGFTKRELMGKVMLINCTIALVLYLIFY